MFNDGRNLSKTSRPSRMQLRRPISLRRRRDLIPSPGTFKIQQSRAWNFSWKGDQSTQPVCLRTPHLHTRAPWGRARSSFVMRTPHARMPKEVMDGGTPVTAVLDTHKERRQSTYPNMGSRCHVLRARELLDYSWSRQELWANIKMQRQLKLLIRWNPIHWKLLTGAQMWQSLRGTNQGTAMKPEAFVRLTSDPWIEEIVMPQTPKLSA